jgi:formylglycine-generating enzyme required for sulfatase activity
MVWVPGGTFSMGSEDFYPEERPVHRVHVDGFWIDQHPVTVAQFRRFVRATNHVTFAEVAPEPESYPGADPDDLVPGSLVFTPPPGPVPLDDIRRWWSWTPGADWRHPEGPGSGLDRRDLHPVTHVAVSDAEAYATWVGGELPTEAEWERAARGGLEGAAYTWGDEPEPRRAMANTWQGRFPWENTRRDGYVRTSPVKSYPPNGYGLFDMAGNVWEWTADVYRDHHPDEVQSPCCVPRNPTVVREEIAASAPQPVPARVIKGGSHLCAPSYCLRYRPAARQSQDIDTSTSHLGFRCVVRVGVRPERPR